MNRQTVIARMKHRRLWLLLGVLRYRSVLVILGLVWLERAYAQHVYPHVSVQGVDIGSLAVPTAR